MMSPYGAALLLCATVLACRATGAESVGPSATAPFTPMPLRAAPVEPRPVSPARELDARASLRLGHYSTKDGLLGVVLDRTGSPPLARVDGSDVVLDLAIRRGSTLTELVSFDEHIVLSIDREGAHFLRIGDQGPVRIIRDGDAEALVRAEAGEVDDALLRRLERSVRDACQAPVSFEVTVQKSAQRGLLHGVHRAALAVRRVCRDEAGRLAVRRGLAKVRLVATKQGEAGIRLDARELVLGAAYEDEAFGPFASEIQSFLEGKL